MCLSRERSTFSSFNRNGRNFVGQFTIEFRAALSGLWSLDCKNYRDS